MAIVNESEVIKRILKILEKWTMDIEEIAKELRQIDCKDNDAYRVFISDQAKKPKQ